MDIPSYTVFVLLAVCIYTVNGNNKTALHVGMLMGISEYKYASSGIKFVNMFLRAVEKICNETDLLGEYYLKIHVRDTKVKIHILFFHFSYSQTTYNFIACLFVLDCLS